MRDFALQKEITVGRHGQIGVKAGVAGLYTHPRSVQMPCSVYLIFIFIGGVPWLVLRYHRRSTSRSRIVRLSTNGRSFRVRVRHDKPHGPGVLSCCRHTTLVGSLDWREPTFPPTTAVAVFFSACHDETLEGAPRRDQCLPTNMVDGKDGLIVVSHPSGPEDV